MAIARATTTADTSDTSSFNVTLTGTVMTAFVVHDGSRTLATATYDGKPCVIQNSQNLVSDGYRVTCFTYVGNMSGSKNITYTWSGGTPSGIRTFFDTFSGANAVEGAAGNYGVTGQLAVVSTLPNAWVVGCGISASSNSGFSGSTNQNGIVSNGGVNLIRVVCGDNGAPLSPAGSYNQVYNIAGFNTAIVGIMVNEGNLPSAGGVNGSSLQISVGRSLAI